MGLKRLDAEAQPIDATRAIAGKILPVLRSGIRFERDLNVIDQRKKRRRRVENPADGLRREQRRRSAAEEYALQLSPAPIVRLRIKLQFPHQCLNIFSLGNFGRYVNVKIAVRALGRAVRDMRVEGERLFVRPHTTILFLPKKLCNRSFSVKDADLNSILPAVIVDFVFPERFLFVSVAEHKEKGKR